MLSAGQLTKAKGLPDRQPLNQSLLEKSHLIDATPWTSDFSFDQIKKLADFMDVYQVDPETVIFGEGDRQAYLVLIVEGRVDVVKLDSDRQPKRITTLGPGKTIGEMCLIDGEPRSASAVAASPATLLVMTAEHFARLNQDFPGISLLLVLKIAKQMSQCLRQTSGRLIDHLGS
jgi:CRP/FNR family cyclic AMP-dependent transcriptional regulator